MYLIRGLIETILFNIYVSHKLFNHLNKQDYKNFLNLFFKANYGHREFSFKSYELISKMIFLLSSEQNIWGKNPYK